MVFASVNFLINDALSAIERAGADTCRPLNSTVWAQHKDLLAEKMVPRPGTILLVVEIGFSCCVPDGDCISITRR